jgi:hypothetical protein
MPDQSASITGTGPGSSHPVPPPTASQTLLMACHESDWLGVIAHRSFANGSTACRIGFVRVQVPMWRGWIDHRREWLPPLTPDELTGATASIPPFRQRSTSVTAVAHAEARALTGAGLGDPGRRPIASCRHRGGNGGDEDECLSAMHVGKGYVCRRCADGRDQGGHTEHHPNLAGRRHDTSTGGETRSRQGARYSLPRCCRTAR